MSKAAVTTIPRMAKMNKKTEEGGVQTQGPGKTQTFQSRLSACQNFEKGLSMSNAQKSFLHMWQTN